ncbi:methyltransferase domain-containing protein [Vibrio cholerae]|nr:methyltransferase domain-containing protein [Vibrio cholerae]BCN20995.1 putative ubiquinone biosynthesis protein [Vibrio cholerae]GHW94405.1 putative S-adenosylmethionine-dependent methyltransferase [Vibrio cholerae]
MANTNPADYNNAYNEYWSSLDRIGETSGDLKKISNQIIETCGFGKVLDIGCGEGKLVAELVNSGVDAFGLDISDVVIERANSRLKGRFKQGSILELPFQDNHFDTVVSTDCMEHLTPDDVPAALKEICRVTGKYVFLQIATTQDRDGHWHLTVEGREWWETKCLEAGFRKHPGYYRLNAYEALNQEPWQIYVLLEKIPQQAIRKYSMEELNKQRILHMDMLREVGRRGDAHCIRYHKAAEYVRPGDTVLDLACGLGYGSHIIYHNSHAKRVIGMDLSESGIEYAQQNYQVDGHVEFSLADAQNIENLPDNSVDFITTFETIEHLPEPKKYLAELERVLKPSGRMLICAPNNWADETGEDPNPHHFHVYTWERLKEECGTHFILEKGFVQTAGGAMKCHHSPRAWHEVPVEGFDCEAEWILLLCMKDPMKGHSLSYSETQWVLPKSEDFNVVNFARDYENPWIVRGTVTRGQRLLNKDLLTSKQLEILSTTPSDSVDYAASLCGYIYSVIENEEYVKSSVVDSISKKIDEYLDLQKKTPHHIRWNVSIAYAAALLYKHLGDINKSLEYFKLTTQFDVAEFSPLLGNKTVDAYFEMAKLHLSINENEKAKVNLETIIQEVIRLSQLNWLNIIGTCESPFPFGMPEMSQLLDKGARAAYMLDNFDSIDARPELIATEAKGYFERIISNHELIISEQNNSLKNLYAEVARLKRDNNVYITEIQRLNKVNDNFSKIDSRMRQSIFYRGLRYIYRRAKVILK